MEKKNFKKALAFTLAEVLITLSILGVVAAITVPSLIQRQHKKEMETQIAKFHSSLEKVFSELEAETGKPLSQLFPSDNTEARKFIANEIVPKFNVKEECLYVNASKNNRAVCKDNNGYSYNLNDGFVILKNNWYINPVRAGFNGKMGIGFDVDLNGKKGPNANGRDRFKVSVLPNDKTGSYDIGKYLRNRATSDDCKRDSHGYDICYFMIVNNKFKFPEDYPFKW